MEHPRPDAVQPQRVVHFLADPLRCCSRRARFNNGLQQAKTSFIETQAEAAREVANLSTRRENRRVIVTVCVWACRYSRRRARPHPHAHPTTTPLQVTAHVA